MFTYPLTLADAIQAFGKYTRTNPGSVEFMDPTLNQLYADEAAGLCTITLKTNSTGKYVGGQSDSTLEITYTDPELELLRRLSI